MDRGAWRAETHRAAVRLSMHHCQGKNKIPGQRHASYCLKVAKVPSTHISWTKASHRVTYTFKATGVCHGTETADKPLCLCLLKWNADSVVNDWEMWRCRNKEKLSEGGTGNNLDYNSATEQNHWTCSSLKDIDKGLTHRPELFLQEADPLQMKAADHKNMDPRLVETRRLMTLQASPWCQPIQELSTSWSRPTLWTLQNSSPPSPVLKGTILRVLGHLWPPLPGEAIKSTLSSFTRNSVPKSLIGTSDQRLSFGNSILWPEGERELLSAQHCLKWKVKSVKSVPQSILCSPMDCSPPCPWNSSGKNTGIGCRFLLQGIFLTQGSNPGLLPCRQILYHLSHPGCPQHCPL